MKKLMIQIIVHLGNGHVACWDFPCTWMMVMQAQSGQRWCWDVLGMIVYEK
jgi:hypothetical protein